jgi:hypothetical protein
MKIECPCGLESRDFDRPEAGSIKLVACPACDRRHLATDRKAYLGIALESHSVHFTDSTPAAPDDVTPCYLAAARGPPNVPNRCINRPSLVPLLDLPNVRGILIRGRLGCS